MTAKQTPDLLDAAHEADGLADELRQVAGGDAVPRQLVDVPHGHTASRPPRKEVASLPW